MGTLVPSNGRAWQQFPVAGFKQSQRLHILMITLHVENDKNKKQNAVEYRKKNYHNFLLFAALPSQPACNYVLPQGMLVVGPSVERAGSDNVGDLFCFCFVNI